MGTPIPPPPPIGDGCIHCESVLWPVGSTPKFVQVVFANIIACVRANFPAPNLSFVMQQDDSLPCEWIYEDDMYKVYWRLYAPSSHLTINEVVSPYYYCFAHTNPFPCQVDYTNELVSCDPPMNAGRLGEAQIVLF